MDAQRLNLTFGVLFMGQPSRAVVQEESSTQNSPVISKRERVILIGLFLKGKNMEFVLPPCVRGHGRLNLRAITFLKS